MKTRKAIIERKTRETQIRVELNVDGHGTYQIETGLPFFNHMLELFAKHSLLDLNLRAKGDLEVDHHHTVEDVGLALGDALNQALGERKGIERYGFSLLPMDETLSRVALDLGGRPYLVLQMANKKKKILDFELSLLGEFLRAFVTQARMNLHIHQLYGADAHHAWESVFKGLARALKMACRHDPRVKGVPSSKGIL
ncbi:MAG TPA: imidazoleglycerol-phosphate dehydratase HisB [Kiritimatiellia bacterium]|jgi:imidazoleglycerol-phosphate dehydratase|nr:MAG: Imidazoleglycerol-phosphate dehydratase [Verrucomicrobia bacterium ADurb.Bin018]HOE00383.1 imidazoleglycerol-phosphate dehydratase HisB [Kiritimatiellia bacterium]HOE37071.1 imidazoleglycerol-phosphate dehydratase HisB [Kiritimatiellia bacterium]HOR74401.1 imidazoleglycerol-phosphate dehydratase HisB [Kiritimatiellia bacterium]HOU59068.1 imidazoleglycerol-phosphate dehydratase HisB [Kiritimatiellia bacterium]